VKESSPEVKPWLKHMKKTYEVEHKKGEVLKVFDTIKEFVLSRRSDIELDMENFGDLKPVLLYFVDDEE